MVRYPVKLEDDTNGTLLVSFPDVPEAHTFGRDREEALTRAIDALETALMGYMEECRVIPAPSPVKKGAFVALPALTEAKLALYSVMRAKRTSKADLCRRMESSLVHVERLLDLRHASRLDQLEFAFRVLGKQLSVHIRDAA